MGFFCVCVCVCFFVGGEKNIENVDPQWVIFIFKMELVLFPEQVWVWGKSLYTVVLSWTYIVFVWGKYLHLVIESYSLLSECSITRKPWSLRVKKQRVKVWGSIDEPWTRWGLVLLKYQAFPVLSFTHLKPQHTNNSENYHHHTLYKELTPLTPK